MSYAHKLTRYILPTYNSHYYSWLAPTFNAGRPSLMSFCQKNSPNYWKEQDIPSRLKTANLPMPTCSRSGRSSPLSSSSHPVRRKRETTIYWDYLANVQVHSEPWGHCFLQTYKAINLRFKHHRRRQNCPRPQKGNNMEVLHCGLQYFRQSEARSMILHPPRC